jgi:hypothetical protein
MADDGLRGGVEGCVQNAPRAGMHACFGGTVMGVIGHQWCVAARGICLAAG